MKKKKSDEPSVAAKNFFNSAQKTMISLWLRWQSESRYEDINDYLKPFERVATKSGVKLLKMQKRPFGLTFSPCDTVDNRVFLLTCSNNSYKSRRVK